MKRHRKPPRRRFEDSETHSAEAAKSASTRTAKRSKSRQQRLRIIGGSLRGRTVVYHGQEFTRPMKDSVRESLFNILGPAIKGAIAIDLFGGTGAVAFEAISRGAQRAEVVERNRRAADIIRSSAETLGIAKQTRVRIGDAFRLGAELLGPPSASDPMDDTPRMIFLCPPYAMWDDSLDRLSSLIQMSMRHCAPGSVLIAETDKHYDVSRLPAGDWDHRIYGGTRLSFIQPVMECGLTCP